VSNGEPLVTVLCATRNAREVVRLTLASLHRYMPEPATVLVADNGSTDGTLQDLRALPWLTVFSVEDRQTTSTAHGPALDWLAARVRTRYFLTLDSDVEFLAPGWLGYMLELAETQDLTALGVYEPGVARVRERLAPFVLLMRAAEFRKLYVSFQPFIRIDDAEEAQRWLARRPRVDRDYNLDADEAASYHTAAVYPTGGATVRTFTEHRRSLGGLA